MFYPLGFIILNALSEIMTNTNPYIEDPFCVGRLVEGDDGDRRFELTDNCDLEPLARPYESFPPSVYVIGGQKAGTSAVTFLLEKNTELQTGYQKEIRFLKFRPDYFKFSGSPQQKYREYEALMANATGPTIDGSPSLHVWGGFFAQNLQYLTNVSLASFPKASFIMRDPLVRLYSHYKMRVSQATVVGGRVYQKRVPTLKEFIKADFKNFRRCGVNITWYDSNFDPRMFYKEDLMSCFHDPDLQHWDFYLAKGMYAWQLWNLKKSVNPNRLLLGCYADLTAWNEGYLKMLTKFIGVDINKEKSGHFLPIQNRSVECPMAYRKRKEVEIDPVLERKLHTFYQKFNDVLREDFGIDCGWTRQLVC